MRKDKSSDAVLPRPVCQPFPEGKMKCRKPRGKQKVSPEVIPQKPVLEPISEEELSGDVKLRAEQTLKPIRFPKPPYGPIY